ncbi:MAG: DUF1294 domain-containing protein [Ruminococcus sp.]|nr:DUF1294 domain-containing protein [Ruminococcus sp.]
MDWYIKLILIYLLIVSFIALVVTIYDKIAAQRNKRRISERFLMLVSFIGGSVSMYITMKVIRHKTLHKKFMIGIPIIIVLQVILTLVIWYLV